ncbi:MAG TPA: GntR family transcriptional regulator [Micromonosporaceae bacterium]
MPVLVVIDALSPVPPFEQIRTGIAEQARSGALAAGTRLPTVRHLADELGVAPGTVARAYKELEADRVVETRGRHGTFISAGRDAAAREAFAAAVDYARRVRRLGISDDVAIGYVTSALESGG